MRKPAKNFLVTRSRRDPLPKETTAPGFSGEGLCKRSQHTDGSFHGGCGFGGGGIGRGSGVGYVGLWVGWGVGCFVWVWGVGGNGGFGWGVCWRDPCACPHILSPQNTKTPKLRKEPCCFGARAGGGKTEVVHAWSTNGLRGGPQTLNGTLMHSRQGGDAARNVEVHLKCRQDGSGS